MDNRKQYILFWALALLGIFGFFKMFSVDSAAVQSKSMRPYSYFIKEIESGGVTEVKVGSGNIVFSTKDGKIHTTYGPFDRQLAQDISNKDVTLQFNLPEEGGSSIWGIFIYLLPTLVFIGFLVFMHRNPQGNKAMGFGKSRAKLMEASKKVKFDDVAGVDEAKEDLLEIVDFLKEPQKFQRLGGKIPRGVLLVGPPGTGKTLLARAIAGEADVPFFSISGSDFVEMFVGVGASRVRDMFEQAKKNSPCIIFIDEIDAVGRHRGAGMGGGNDEREQTLNQLLVEMDGFEENQGVIIVAATNRPDVLDAALLRPGRFDRQVTVPNPDLKGREQILKVHLKKVPLNTDVDPTIIARGTPGFSGADLANLINEAALMAARSGQLSVCMLDFEKAKDKVMMGAERRSLIMKEEEKKLTAYHEGGHAIVAHHMPDSDPIHKATIVPRGRALGLVMRLPEDDRVSQSRAKLYADIKVAMGGRLAEELIFGYDRVTTGASSDIKMATMLARAMVKEWGLCSELGFQAFSDDNKHYPPQNAYSEDTARKIDESVKRILDQCYEETRKLLTDHIDQLHTIANALMEFETLTGAEIKDLLEGKTLDKTTYEKKPSPTSGFFPSMDE